MWGRLKENRWACACMASGIRQPYMHAGTPRVDVQEIIGYKEVYKIYIKCMELQVANAGVQIGYLWA